MLEYLLRLWQGVNEREVNQCTLILAIEGLFVNGSHGEGQPKVRAPLNRVVQNPWDVTTLKSAARLPP